MAYCDVADIYNIGIHGGQIYDDNTTPTLDQVEAAIDRIYTEINSNLYAFGVTIPIVQSTSPNAYTLLKYLNAIGASAEAENITYQELAGINTQDVNVNLTVTKLYRNYKELLKKYCEEPIYLIDAERTANSLLKENIETDIWSGTKDKYDYSYVDDLEDEAIKPYVRYDTEW